MTLGRCGRSRAPLSLFPHDPSHPSDALALRHATSVPLSLYRERLAALALRYLARLASPLAPASASLCAVAVVATRGRAVFTLQTMSGWISYLTGRGSGGGRDATREALINLREHLLLLDKKETHLGTKIEEELRKAKANATTNPRGESFFEWACVRSRWPPVARPELAQAVCWYGWKLTRHTHTQWPSKRCGRRSCTRMSWTVSQAGE